MAEPKFKPRQKPVYIQLPCKVAYGWKVKGERALRGLSGVLVAQKLVEQPERCSSIEGLGKNCTHALGKVFEDLEEDMEFETICGRMGLVGLKSGGTTYLQSELLSHV